MKFYILFAFLFCMLTPALGFCKAHSLGGKVAEELAKPKTKHGRNYAMHQLH